MTYQVLLTSRAEADLRGIYSYIGSELLSPENAAEQISRIRKYIEELAVFPLRFWLYDCEPWRTRGLRILRVDNYLVFYVVDEMKTVVTVIRVMYGGMDLDSGLAAETLPSSE